MVEIWHYLLIILFWVSVVASIFIVIMILTLIWQAFFNGDSGAMSDAWGFLILLGISCSLCYLTSGHVSCNFSLRGQEGQLKKKVEELSELRGELIIKKSSVKKLQSEYQTSINGLVEEIKREKRKSGIRSFTQAKKHLRISYDLTLIQRKKAYISKLQEVEKKLENGTYELEFLERQATDDLRIVQTLGSDEVKDLMTDINQVIEKYLPESGELVIDIDPNSMQTPEEIWREIN